MLLEGLRVVEFSQLIAAPLCGLTLADLGAEVVKVESPAGDDARRLPPFRADGNSAFFHALNRALQASMGLMALTGERDGPPLRVPVPLIDLTTGMYAAQSALTALWRAERTGRGALLDCALLDGAATLTSL